MNDTDVVIETAYDVTRALWCVVGHYRTDDARYGLGVFAAVDDIEAASDYLRRRLSVQPPPDRMLFPVGMSVRFELYGVDTEAGA